MSWETVSAAIPFWPDGDNWQTNGTSPQEQICGDQRKFRMSASLIRATLAHHITKRADR
jgi:hypothetical protein